MTKAARKYGIASTLVLALALSSVTAARPCSLTLAQLIMRRAKEKVPELIRVAAKPLGLIVGSANDVVITLLGGGGFLPASVGRWLPLANEMANVAATSTGKRWLYDGVTKHLADGVALGAIAGHSLTAAALHGPVAGGLTLAANLGLTFWFPNTYFHPIMEGIPEKIPARFKRTKAFAKSGLGQATIGVSLIMVIEQILQKAESLAEHVTLFPSSEGDDDEESKIKKGLALYLMDGVLLGQSHFSDRDKDEILIYLAGGDVPKPSLSLSGENILSLEKALEGYSLKQLLNAKQISKVKQRLEGLRALPTAA